SCQVGLRGYLASRILKNNGYQVKNVDGGWKTYSSVYGSNINNNVETKTNDLGETEIVEEPTHEIYVDSVVDVSGLTCPMPIVKLKKGIDSLESGQVIELHVTDRGALNDLPAWSKNAGHTILNTEQDDKLIKFWIKKK
ncbi:MAG: CoA-disulfide reductase, partial [Neobacillus sp.]|nr:CoA-disulfide reductase [Neobacillus sp.]